MLIIIRYFRLFHIRILNAFLIIIIYFYILNYLYLHYVISISSSLIFIRTLIEMLMVLSIFLLLYALISVLYHLFLLIN